MSGAKSTPGIDKQILRLARHQQLLKKGLPVMVAFAFSCGLYASFRSTDFRSPPSSASRNMYRSVTCPHMNAESGVGGVSGNGRRGYIPYSRLGEFADAGGDHVLQENLVRDVLWRVAQVTSEDFIDEKIRQFDQRVPEIISDLWYV